ncbi:MAG TPA: YibE/F family protein [Acidimicrobiales bacterium]|nr:YibE/F family protein [Acidimicrobiales bacterium]
MGHVHVHPSEEAPASPQARRMLLVLLAPLIIATVAGLVVLWPSEVRPDLSAEFGAPDDLVDAQVVGLQRGPCPGTPDEADIRCVTPTVEILGGADRGRTVTLQPQSRAAGVDFDIDERVVLGYTAAAEEDFQYYFADRERRGPLLVLGILFAVAVIGLGRFHGFRALLGVGISLLALTTFVLPAVLEGSNPLAVALVGSSFIAFVSLYLAHGLNARTTTALLGSLGSLALVGVLSTIFVAASRFSGLADEEALFLSISAVDLDLTGLLLGGIVIGTLGVLYDVTVTQASAVWELQRANPRYTRWELYRSAIRIGRDHIAATVNTLVLAYAGASLPLFLIFTQADIGLLDAVNGELVAVEIVRTLCGSIGLVASVPLTTGLAALVVRGPEPPSTEGEDPVDGDEPPDEAEAVPAAKEAAATTPTADNDPRHFRSRGERSFWG